MKAKPKASPSASDPIRPDYYRRGGLEVFDAAEAWGIDKDAYIFTALKYIVRVGHKESADPIHDLKKARAYIDRRIAQLEAK